MLTYNFANIGSDSLYEYLYKCIKNDILLGNIRPGEKLPSKRTFAKNLGISVITVENAYAQLVAEGYLYSMPKRGFYAADLEIEDSMRDAVPKEILQVANGETSYFADFSSNQTDSEIFPFTIWTRTVRAVLNDNRIQLMINSPCAGILKLRSAIVKYLREFRGMQVLPEQIIVGAGTEYLHNLLIQLLGNDLVYGVEDPGYHKIARIYESMKVRYEPVPLDQDGVSVQELEKRSVDIIHTSPSHHFPTGTVMPVSRRYELLGWAAKSDHHYIIEDDYDSELRLGGKQFPTLQSIDVSDKVIYMNTFTKTLASTVRISYMVLPQTLAEKFYRELSFYSCTVSNFEQYTLAEFIENGSFEKTYQPAAELLSEQTRLNSAGARKETARRLRDDRRGRSWRPFPDASLHRSKRREDRHAGEIPRRKIKAALRLLRRHSGGGKAGKYVCHELFLH